MENTSKNILNKKKKFALNQVFVFPIAPRRQFRNLIIVGFVFFVGIIVFHTNFFRNVESQNIFQANTVTSTPVPKINEQKLKAVLARFDTKKTVQTNVLNLTPVVADPGK